MDQKSKMVSFRLSAVEYARIHQACETIGIRSVSEFARAALYRMIHNHDGQENSAIDFQVQDLREKLESLSAELDRIGSLVKRTN